MNETMIGQVVQYTVGGEAVFGGILEYLTADGWAGIRGPDGRLDEAPAHLVEPDPT